MNTEIAKWSLVATDTLVPDPKNARTHTPEQLQKISKVIQSLGWINPIVIDEKSQILAGHARHQAAIELGIKKVPVVKVTHLSPEQKKAYMLADNRLAMEAQWDYDLLRTDLEWLSSLEIDLDLTGFNRDEIITFLDSDDSLFPDGSADQTSLKRTKLKTDDDSALFELVMGIANKNKLVEVINKVKAKKGFNSIEESLMEIVKAYDKSL